MAITINALAAPQFNLPINVLAQLDTTGGGAAWAWTLLDKPSGSAAVLSNPALQNPAITPDITGTYLLRCIIDGVTSEFAVFSVIADRSLLRVPAAGEGAANLGGALAGARSWAEASNERFRFYDRWMETGPAVICKNISGGAVTRGSLVYVNGTALLYNALPEEHTVPTVDLADATAMTTLGTVGMVLGKAGHQADSVANNELAVVMFGGIVEGLNTLGKAVNDPVYVTNVAGTFGWTPGTFKHLVGYVAKVDAAIGAISIAPARFQTFLDASDTPSTYAGQALRIARVNAGETALEFIDPASAPELATIVVGSVDSGDTVENVSDPAYLHENGVTDGLAAAIAAAGSSDLIYIRPGDYVTLADLVSSASIIGAGRGVTTIRKGGTANGRALNMSTSYTRLQNITVETILTPLAGTEILLVNGLGCIIDNVNVVGPNVTGTLTAGVRISSSNPLVRNLTSNLQVTPIEVSGDGGVYESLTASGGTPTGTQLITVSGDNNQFKDVEAFATAAGALIAMVYVTGDGNEFDHLVADASTFANVYGLYLFQALKAIFINSTISTNDFYALLAINSTEIIVKDSTITSDGADAVIQINVSGGNSVENIRFENCKIPAPNGYSIGVTLAGGTDTCKKLKVLQCDLQSSLTNFSAVHFVENGGYNYNALVQDNEITYGLAGARGVTTTGSYRLVVDNNTFLMGAYANTYGIYATTGNDQSFVNNKYISSGSTTIGIYTAPALKLDVSGNLFNFSGPTAVAIAYKTFTSALGATIEKNILYLTGDNAIGITVDSFILAVAITGNILFMQGASTTASAGIYLQNNCNTTISGNYIYMQTAGGAVDEAKKTAIIGDFTTNTTKGIIASNTIERVGVENYLNVGAGHKVLDGGGVTLNALI